MIDQKKLDEFMEKAKKIEKGHRLDLSSDEDLSIGIMNLISIEEHLFFTANKTGKTSYYELLAQIREMRKELLKMIIKDYEGEVWCTSKHLLAASMRVMEVGTKALATDREHAYHLFEMSYNLYNLFWALNLHLINDDEVDHEFSQAQKEALLADIAQEDAGADNLDKIASGETQSALTQTKPEPQTDTPRNQTTWQKLGKTLNKMLDCCRE